MSIELEIDNATQYATAYQGGKPVATFQRRRVYEKGPAWKCFDTSGTLLFQTHTIASAEYLAKRLALVLAQRRVFRFVVIEHREPGTFCLWDTVDEKRHGSIYPCRASAAEFALLMNTPENAAPINSR